MRQEWSIVYPHRRTPWAALAADGVTPARFDPETGLTEPVDPAADAALPGLAHVLGLGRLVSYRPGRRAVVATGDCHIKIVRPGRVADMVARHEVLAATAIRAGLRAPAVLWTDDSVGAMALETIAGTTLNASMWTVAPDRMAELGSAIALVASSHAVPPLAPRSDDASWWLEAVARWDQAPMPGMLRRLDALLSIVVPTGAGSTVHGDLHDKNVIVTSDGFALIDLDGAAAGSSSTDLVAMVAHFELRAVQGDVPEGMRDRQIRSLVSGFESVLTPRGLAPAVARELARLVCVYRFRQAGRPLSATLLDRAERLQREAA
jgi:tRNA A-37 threonylcarbamoyl transferase component Bud32